MSKLKTQWHSSRLNETVSFCRWGDFGDPVLLFPTAGGDAEEIERFHCIRVLDELISAGRIKVYSCDSVGGRVMATKEGPPAYRMAMKNRFQEYVRYEVVPAIRTDCQSEDIEIITAGASIGAFNALAMTCRYPDIFKSALCMSGSYDMERFLEAPANEEFYFASPLHYLPSLEGEQLDRLRERFIVLASGEGKAENIGESWRVAHALGEKGIPNRVDSWGADWDHDWPTWRNMLPKYLEELTTPPEGA